MEQRPVLHWVRGSLGTMSFPQVVLTEEHVATEKGGRKSAQGSGGDGVRPTLDAGRQQQQLSRILRDESIACTKRQQRASRVCWSWLMYYSRDDAGMRTRRIYCDGPIEVS